MASYLFHEGRREASQSTQTTDIHHFAFHTNNILTIADIGYDLEPNCRAFCDQAGLELEEICILRDFLNQLTALGLLPK